VLEWLQARGETLDACIVGEPSNPEALGDEIKIGRRGSLTCELVVQGKQGHAAYPHKADNPVPKLARIIDRLSATEIDRGSACFGPSNLQVTVISVPNRASNVIPAEARAWVRTQCEAAAASINARYDLTFAGTGDVFLTEAGPLVGTMSEAVEAVTGRKPALTTGGGTSDARFIKDACPVIEFGLVNKTIHAVDEHVPLRDLEQLTAIYTSFLERYFA
jgi:succinyl-diaminopimelate desuccinylase